MNFASGIRRARERVGISQRKLASKAGFNASYVNLLETGKRKPSMESLEAFAAALEIPMTLLLLSCAEKNDLNGIGESKAKKLFGLLLEVVNDGHRSA
jgi:transcriptional regulator with XRE-family HTH domain